MNAFFLPKSTRLDYALAAPERIDVLKKDITLKGKSTMTMQKSIKKHLEKYQKVPKAWTESPDPAGELSNFSNGFYFDK